MGELAFLYALALAVANFLLILLDLKLLAWGLSGLYHILRGESSARAHPEAQEG